MGLHSKVRCEIMLKGKTSVEQADEIVRFTEELYRFIYSYNHLGKISIPLTITQKFARFVSKSFNFPGYSDDEVFKFIDRYNDIMRK